MNYFIASVHADGVVEKYLVRSQRKDYTAIRQTLARERQVANESTVTVKKATVPDIARLMNWEGRDTATVTNAI